MQPHGRETAVPFSVVENRNTQGRTQTPSATRVTHVAAGSLGTMGEYSLSTGQIHGALRAGDPSPAASDLGIGISDDDSLVVSPDGPEPRRLGLGALKRDGRARVPSGKRMAISASPGRLVGRQVRKASPAPVEWGVPRDRGPPDDRYTVLERQMQHLEQQIGEHTRMGVDLRRELFGRFGEVADQMGIVEVKFLTMEAALDAKLAEIDSKIGKLHAQLPADGRMVAEGFDKLAHEIEAIKQRQGEIFTKKMVDELELMRHHVISHEQALGKIAGSATHFQMLTDGLSAVLTA